MPHERQLPPSAAFPLTRTNADDARVGLDPLRLDFTGGASGTRRTTSVPVQGSCQRLLAQSKVTFTMATG